MSEKKSKVRDSAHAKRWAFLRRPPAFLDPLMTKVESPGILRKIRPYVKEGQTAADLGCGWGFYSIALADIVGPEGMVYSVDLSKNTIGSVRKKAEEGGYRNIEAITSTAADLSFIKDKSVDFVFANGLLCSMANDRQMAVSEIKRIIKPKGHAYLSLGSPPPFGFVDEAEWQGILEEFKVVSGGSYKELCAVVSLDK
ncbi:MAG: class I SAM-dependent methyltransferase [ANME-2 cluster archaeon]|nr:MAG: class I SAM-dependent methyltransferase [ANME-2 cluster archaeon]